MCKNPIRIVTKSRYVNAHSIGSNGYITVNCGKCSECKEMKINEYYVRTKAECERVHEAGGYVYWDTLTYSQENVPVFKSNGTFTRGFYNKEKDDLLCFSRDDYRNFFKRLRKNLTLSGYDVAGNIKYFFVSEYGGKTHRPHYHCVFFISDPNLDAVTLENHIIKAWKLGINDIETPTMDKVIRTDGALKYVAKYVVKDDEFTEMIHKLSYKKSFTKEQLKEILPFHRQSQGYGEYIIQQKDFIFKNGKMLIDTPKGKTLATVPMYVKRKLFFEQVTNYDGTKRWIYNERGKEFYLSQIDTMIDEAEKRLSDSLTLGDRRSISLYRDKPLERVKMLLGARTLRDVAIYQLFYCGRIKPQCAILPSVKEMIEYYFNEQKIDYSELENKFINNENISDFYTIYNKINNVYYNDGNQFIEIVTGDVLRKDEFLRRYTISSISYPQFTYFDQIIDIVRYVDWITGMEQDEEYKKKQQIKARLRTLKNKYKF